jgi:hypothetical protein
LSNQSGDNNTSSQIQAGTVLMYLNPILIILLLNFKMEIATRAIIWQDEPGSLGSDEAYQAQLGNSNYAMIRYFGNVLPVAADFGTINIISAVGSVTIQQHHMD